MIDNGSELLGSDDLLIVGVDEDTGLALVLGQSTSEIALGDAVDTVPERQARRLVELFGVGAKFAPAFSADHGRWVRLTSDSAKAFADLGIARDSSGMAMGVVRGADGQFAHMSRFDFMSPVPFDPGTFAAALAVQQVVKQIEAKLDEIAQGVEALVRGTKNEVEASVVSAADVIGRIERRVRDRGVVDDSDWASLAAVEVPVKQAYHQTYLWLDPLRAFLAEEDASLLDQVRALRGEVGISDADFWLRMHVHSELTLKRWELLYLLREAELAPERLSQEANEIRDRAIRRHEQLSGLTELLADYLNAERPTGIVERLRFISRHRLSQLRRELALVTNAYADALGRASVTVPEYVYVPPTEPLIDFNEIRQYLKESAIPGLESGAKATSSAITAWGRAGRRRLSEWATADDAEDSEVD